MLSEPQPGMPVLEQHAMPIEPQRQRRSRTMYSAEYKLRVVREALARPQACRIKPTCREHPGIEPVHASPHAPPRSRTRPLSRPCPKCPQHLCGCSARGPARAIHRRPHLAPQTQLRKWIKNIETLESLAKLEARQLEIRRDFMAKAPPNNIADARAQTGLDNPMHAGDHPNLMGSTAPLQPPAKERGAVNAPRGRVRGF